MNYKVKMRIVKAINKKININNKLIIFFSAGEVLRQQKYIFIEYMICSITVLLILISLRSSSYSYI